MPLPRVMPAGTHRKRTWPVRNIQRAASKKQTVKNSFASSSRLIRQFGAITARGIFGHTTSVLFVVFIVALNCGVNVWFAESVGLFPRPASPVCRDTLVSATVGAAKNRFSKTGLGNFLSSADTTLPVLVTTLNGTVCSDITHPLLLAGDSHKLLMRELFPQSIQKASGLKNS